MILILDIGKTNKKCFVFDEDYQIVFEQTTQLPETTDEDGDSCEDINLLTTWVLDTWQTISNDARFQIQAINVTTYGASLVHLNAEGQPVTPLYNYLKIFPEALKKQFFNTYGDAKKMALETASPLLGMLNSGLQLYWLKYYKTLVFQQAKYTLHLPQYIIFLISQKTQIAKLPPDYARSELTSIGCHTMLWDFRKNDYHDWVKAENMVEKFPPIAPRPVRDVPQQGSGLHDSSAALIPYLASFEEPFVLISTGTWCISLSPFNQEPLTTEELVQDCLCYLTYAGQPVKAARFFGGYAHEQAVKEMAATFGVEEDFYQSTQLSEHYDLSESYTAFMRQLVEKQVVSTKLAIGKSPLRHIFVDGGFSKNEIYMTLLAEAFPGMEVFAAEVAQATALGAALAIHPLWNEKPVPTNLISLKKYSAKCL